MAVETKILTSIKKVLGIAEDYTVYDEDITMHANAAFSTLQQLKVGPANGFILQTGNETWDSVFTDPLLSMIKTYIYLKVRLTFDPPDKAYVLSAMQENVKELEWRMNVLAEREGYV